MSTYLASQVASKVTDTMPLAFATLWVKLLPGEGAGVVAGVGVGVAVGAGVGVGLGLLGGTVAV